MKYIKFTIENYKGLCKIVLDLDKKPSTNIFTLVGLNESGKTSVLEAINLFEVDIDKKNAHFLIPKSQQHTFSKSVSVIATLRLEEEEKAGIKKYIEEQYKFFLSEDIEDIEITKNYNFIKSVPKDDDDWKNSLWSMKLIGKTKNAKKEVCLSNWKTKTIPEKKAWNAVIAYIKKQFLPKILYYPNFLFEFPEKIYLETIDNPNINKEKQIEYKNVLQDILDSLNKDINIEDDLLVKMKNKNNPAHRPALDQLLLKVAEKLNEQILLEWDEIFAAGGGQQKEIELKDGEDDIGGCFVQIKIKQGSDSYSINERSLGFRWFFSFLIFTSFRKSRGTDNGETLFLLDEPASNLHQRSQQKLLETLQKIISGCKLVYSTHSHHLINPKWLAGTYIVKNKAINYGNPENTNVTQTEISATLYKNFVASYPKEEEHFRPILDSLQYMPSKLEMVPNTIFTEGKNDYYTLKYIVEIILQRKDDLNFYPGGGVNKYSDVFRLYLAWNKEFLAVFDSDIAGIKAQKKYINEIGVDIESKIFILTDIDSKWKNFSTENLFLDTEKLNITQTSFPEHEKKDGFNKSKFNTAIQQLYINDDVFELNKTTKEKFTKIIDFIIKKQK